MQNILFSTLFILDIVVSLVLLSLTAWCFLHSL